MSVPPVDACYHGRNDISGLPVEGLKIDDGNEYLLEGDPITLGGGGLTAVPAAGTSDPAGDAIGLPIDLAGSQIWSVSGRGGDHAGENGVLLEDGISGEGDVLTVGLASGAAFYLEGDTEVGGLKV